ncbi:hypothetical protein OAK49_01005 [Euryarchaeota archaeon]|nr:hypothetical protein [Euryarchaeota archaeon]
MSEIDRDEWEDQMLEEMAKMFSQMGMPIDKSDLEQMMSKIREQFENMGIDAEKMVRSDVKMNFQGDPEVLRKQMETMLSGSEGIAELFRNMGINVQVNSDQEEANVEIEETEEAEELDIPVEDTYVDGDSMYVTLDVSSLTDLEEGKIELSLTDGGSVLQLMRTTQPRPFKRMNLPKPANSVTEWNLNNGILDVTFDLA